MTISGTITMTMREVDRLQSFRVLLTGM